MTINPTFDLESAVAQAEGGNAALWEQIARHLLQAKKPARKAKAANAETETTLIMPNVWRVRRGLAPNKEKKKIATRTSPIWALIEFAGGIRVLAGTNRHCPDADSLHLELKRCAACKLLLERGQTAADWREAYATEEIPAIVSVTVLDGYSEALADACIAERLARVRAAAAPRLAAWRAMQAPLLIPAHVAADVLSADEKAALDALRIGERAARSLSYCPSIMPGGLLAKDYWDAAEKAVADAFRDVHRAEWDAADEIGAGLRQCAPLAALFAGDECSCAQCAEAA